MKRTSIQLLRAHWDPYGGKRPDADTQLILAFFAHRAHAPADSLWGRCTNCGMTWESEQRAATLLNPKLKGQSGDSA